MMRNSIAKRIIKASRLLIFDPVMFFKKTYSIIRSLYPLSKYPIKKKIKGINFVFDFAYDPAIRHMYCGDYESQTIKIMKRFLHRGDIFIDIGANIGYLSAVAAGLVGINGQVHCFEPAPKQFSRLRNIVLLNKEYNIKVNQFALGEESGTAKLSITNLANIGWNTIVPGFMSQETTKESVDVFIRRFDDYAYKNSLKKVSLVKIDTEGFEFPVLKGFSGFFKNASTLPVILCEIAPSAYSFLGYTLSQLFEYMKYYSYEAFNILDMSTKIRASVLEKTTNVLFIPKYPRNA